MHDVKTLIIDFVLYATAFVAVVLLSMLLFISTTVWCLFRPFIAVGLFFLRAVSADRSIPARAEKTIKKLDEEFGMWG